MPDEPISIARRIEAESQKVKQQVTALRENVAEINKLADELDFSVQTYFGALKPWMAIETEVSDLHKLIAKRLRGLIIKFSWNYLQKKLLKSVQSAFDESEDLNKNNLSFVITSLSINESKGIFCIKKEKTDVIALHIEGNLSDNRGIIPTQLIKVDLLVRMALKSPNDDTLILTPVISRPIKIWSSLKINGNDTILIKNALTNMIAKKIKSATIPAKINLPFLPTKASENRWQTDHKSYCLITHLEASEDCILSGHFFSYAKGVSSNGAPIDLPEGVLTDVVVQVNVFSAMPTNPNLNVPDVVPTHARPDWADAEFHISTKRFVEIITTELKRQIYAASSVKDVFQSNDNAHAGYCCIQDFNENGSTIKKFVWIGGFPIGWYSDCIKGAWHWNNWQLEYVCEEFSPLHLVGFPFPVTGEFTIADGTNGKILRFEVKAGVSDQYNKVMPIPLGDNIEQIEYLFDDDFISIFIKFKEL
ncbi:hypothetical protein SNE25_11950 [Mucilaginibacter sabulilitoris]|uniref:Uncharacterized protein n=1 Tax=Mucilaginibacter sabulilitoris TaxID=1173583 RepID=A0ABZ0TTZ3_9SPHI|nr:hypothetical protein [Mucilaginibacter sabulilitoris]WPU96231.1 hypothetical protein SNE25_11950 [Mucilaginibacter sabulilitoris]